ncbi:MAG: hypothetical protein A3E31_09585 [Candidatus Rokubacteria bacterium RIFCSPHIGHO2_12_FULL_73_22]|nr:MAG: hypothetical protein A3D33_03265 [Candidatus Rokubacteria bacterium RIFCSPHIGHO2_02_FULL_73_26]OGL03226.1 MAG: hypothetical protein A3E31_09585 [Candidatus Rokubacteria bacterium RIFCSPHIGHO2_12_FULL_73_22]OGL08363.1 MAG: hypothetical protein A3I14_14310 [Candidatus Rokubacteria bacterium RIFCSPLOWO2_02_FULL_73_56]OGL24400.1 MAG: hypothetical protein A3G44_10905 [Candidatus Rokubacteria bacterium RIFCSPLOWO2_12_FULL_73_47]
MARARPGRAGGLTPSRRPTGRIRIAVIEVSHRHPLHDAAYLRDLAGCPTWSSSASRIRAG